MRTIDCVNPLMLATLIRLTKLDYTLQLQSTKTISRKEWLGFGTLLPLQQPYLKQNTQLITRTIVPNGTATILPRFYPIPETILIYPFQMTPKNISYPQKITFTNTMMSTLHLMNLLSKVVIATFCINHNRYNFFRFPQSSNRIYP